MGKKRKKSAKKTVAKTEIKKTEINKKINSTNLFLYMGKSYIQLGLLTIVVVIVYGHTLDVPFFFDDFASIRERALIYNWRGSWTQLWSGLGKVDIVRIMGFLSFALNYKFHQFNVAGFHIVNITIHILAGSAVLFLMRGIRIQLFKNNNNIQSDTNTFDRLKHDFFPIVTALIFVLHPLQIQAVTYIVQRFASLTALFYITAMVCFIQARMTHITFCRCLWILACIFSGLLALFTKQNAATLPVALLLLELIFFKGTKIRLLIAGFITLSGLAAVWFIVAWIFNYDPFSLHAMQVLTRETTQISRTSYLATQMGVLWTYIRLFFMPLNLHIDYWYPIAENFLSIKTIFAVAGHLAILCIGWYNLRRRPIIAFGIFFFYIAHGVESSFLPIRDVIFEHRTYLPNLGLAMLCGWLLVVELPKLLSKKIVQTVTICLLLAIGSATWARNQMWRDPIVLWQHNLEQSPEKDRSWLILGRLFIEQGEHEIRHNQAQFGKIHLKKGLECLNHAIKKQQANKSKNRSENKSDKNYKQTISTDTLLNIIVAYKLLGEYQQALALIDNACKQKLSNRDRAKFLVNKGNIYYEYCQKYYDNNNIEQATIYYKKSEKAFRQAISIYPNTVKARCNLASILGWTGKINEAITLCKKAITIDKSNIACKQLLQRLQYQ